ncbi:MAG: sodium/solute symporter [Planctomycetota bacterium]|nr:sodium/solute symporter [Planctomycetota bacterium]
MTLLAAAGQAAVETSHLEFADKMVLVGYFVLMLGIGAYFYRFMRGMKDYFSGGNNIPWWLSGVSFYMSSFSVFAFVSYSALAYKYGWAGVTLLWVAVPATVFSVTLFAKRWRRARIDSPVEYLETRYSAGFRQLIAWQGIPVKMVDDGLKLVAIGTFISVSLGLPMQECMFWSGIIILLYTFMGGLWAVAVTDFIQFVVMAIAVLILLPLSIDRIGGLENLDKIAPAGINDFFTAEYNWVYVVLLSLLYCVAWSSVNWPLIQRYYCVADEKEALKVGWFVTVLNVIGPPLMFIPAMAAVHFLGDIPGKEVYPRLCVELLPPGILGLVVAAMFAATMSMLSSDYNVCAGVLTNDVYRRLFRRNASEKELVAVGRLLTLVIGGFALGAAFMMSAGTGEDLFKTMVTLFSIVTAPVGVPMILGLLSRRVTNLGALVGWFVGIIVGLALLRWCPGTIEIVIGDGDGGVFAAQLLEKEIVIFTSTLIVTLFVTLAVSLLVPMKVMECQRADDFIDRLQAPIGSLEEDRATAGGTAFSPFGVVGFSIIIIGVMLLAVVPWVGTGLPVWLTVGFGVLLLVIGGMMLFFGRNQAKCECGASDEGEK